VPRIIRDYRCGNCDAVSEHWASAEELAALRCPDCGSSALVAMIAAAHLNYTSMVASGESSSDGMTSSIDKWDKMRRQKLKTEQRNLDRHGTTD
jgi:DNA-directed RNA polymerase subunit RPC12/RpoP